MKKILLAITVLFPLFLLTPKPTFAKFGDPCKDILSGKTGVCRDKCLPLGEISSWIYTPPFTCREGLNMGDCCYIESSGTPGGGGGANPSDPFSGFIDLRPNKFDLTGGKCSKAIWTALGCFPFDLVALLSWIVKLLTGLSGGIAFLLSVFGGFKILTSSGDPKGVQAGKEMITSAITGLLFTIFSVFLLQLIGVNILQIPGLGND